MDVRYETFGALVYFFPAGRTFIINSAGATVAATPATRLARPGAADTNWLDLDNCHVKAKITRTSAKKMRWAPGGWQLDKKKNISRETEYTLKVHKAQNLVFELLFGTLPLGISPAAGGQYNPLEGEETEGWLQVQKYGSAGTIVNTTIGWVDLELTSEVDFGPKEFECDLLAAGLFSTLNSGNLA